MTERSMESFVAPDLQTLIHPHTGDLGDIRPATRGFSSDFLAVVECENGPFFVKAMRNRPGWRHTSIVCERLINPFVQPVSPPLLWDAEDEEWIALGFEFVDGRPANFDEGSPDLPVVVDLVNRIGELALPEVARGWQEKRWDRFAADESEVALFRGDALLHTDINPDNLIVGSGDAWVVDWADPSRGAAFIGPAVLVLQLVSSGHSPESAESWAAGCKAWANAAPKAIDAFAAANVRMFSTLAHQRPEEPWLRAMAEAAASWAHHRGVRWDQ